MDDQDYQNQQQNPAQPENQPSEGGQVPPQTPSQPQNQSDSGQPLQDNDQPQPATEPEQQSQEINTREGQSNDDPIATTAHPDQEALEAARRAVEEAAAGSAQETASGNGQAPDQPEAQTDSTQENGAPQADSVESYRIPSMPNEAPQTQAAPSYQNDDSSNQQNASAEEPEADGSPKVHTFKRKPMPSGQSSARQQSRQPAIQKDNQPEEQTYNPMAEEKPPGLANKPGATLQPQSNPENAATPSSPQPPSPRTEPNITPPDTQQAQPAQASGTAPATNAPETVQPQPQSFQPTTPRTTADEQPIANNSQAADPAPANDQAAGQQDNGQTQNTANEDTPAGQPADTPLPQVQQPTEQPQTTDNRPASQLPTGTQDQVGQEAQGSDVQPAQTPPVPQPPQAAPEPQPQAPENVPQPQPEANVQQPAAAPENQQAEQPTDSTPPSNTVQPTSPGTQPQPQPQTPPAPSNDQPVQDEAAYSGSIKPAFGGNTIGVPDQPATPAQPQPDQTDPKQPPQTSAEKSKASNDTFQLPQSQPEQGSADAQQATAGAAASQQPVVTPQATDQSSQPKEAKSLKDKARQGAKKIKKMNYKPFMSAAIIGIIVYGIFNSQVILGQVQYLTTPSGGLDAPAASVDTTAPAGEEDKILIPKLNVDVPVVYDEPSFEEEKVQKALERGVVHYGNTAMPGENGNNVIVGHSSNNWWDSGKYKFAFILLDKLDDGDEIILHYDGTRYVYEVNGKEVVEPTDISVLNQTEDPTLTLITCTPPGTSWQRLVVTAEQVSPDPDQNQDTSRELDLPGGSLPSDSSGGFMDFFRNLF